jgi:lipopolysaccharide transport system permease protein
MRLDVPENQQEDLGAPDDTPPAAGAEPPPPSDLPETVIEPGRGWKGFHLGELWKYRELLLLLAWRDVRVRYRQTVFGAAWAVLQPLALMAVFSLFLGRFVRPGLPDNVPYSIFLYSGLLPWTFFATAVSFAANSIVASEQLVTKVYFSRLVIPVASVGACLLDFVVAFGVLLVMMVFSPEVRVGWGLLAVPALTVLLLLAALSFGTFLAALNVAYRDVRFALPFLMQLWMFATPAVYLPPAKGPGAPVVSWIDLNPMNGLVAFFRAVTLDSPQLPWARLGVSAAVIAVAFLVAGAYFRRVEDSFADII